VKSSKVYCIVGTNGSGKSTLIRKVLGDNPEPLGDRKGIKWTQSGDVAAAGWYKNACGGCDGIKNMDTVEATVAEMVEYQIPFVLYEGILICTMASIRRLDLFYGIKPTIIHLALTTEECIASVEARRKLAGNDEPLNPNNLLSKHRSVAQFAVNARAEGYEVLSMNREDAELYLLGEIYDDCL